MNEAQASLARVRDAVHALAPESWSGPEMMDRLAEVSALEQSLAAVRLSVVNKLVTENVPRRQTGTSSVDWLAGTLQISHYAAGKMVRLAKALPATTPDTAKMLATGDVNVDQASVIVQAVNRLPEAFRPEGETYLLNRAGEMSSAQLRHIGAQLQDKFDPAGAQQRRQEMLATRSRRNVARRGIHLSRVDGDMMVLLRGRMESETADVIRAALDPIRVPRSDLPTARGPGRGNTTADGASAGDLRTAAARRLDALKDICLAVLADGSTPESGRRRRADDGPGSAGAAGKQDRRRARRQQRHQSKKRPRVGGAPRRQQPAASRAGVGSVGNSSTERLS